MVSQSEQFYQIYLTEVDISLICLSASNSNKNIHILYLNTMKV